MQGKKSAAQCQYPQELVLRCILTLLASSVHSLKSLLEREFDYSQHAAVTDLVPLAGVVLGQAQIGAFLVDVFDGALDMTRRIQ